MKHSSIETFHVNILKHIETYRMKPENVYQKVEGLCNGHGSGPSSVKASAGVFLQINTGSKLKNRTKKLRLKYYLDHSMRKLGINYWREKAKVQSMSCTALNVHGSENTFCKDKDRILVADVQIMHT